MAKKMPEKDLSQWTKKTARGKTSRPSGMAKAKRKVDEQHAGGSPPRCEPVAVPSELIDTRAARASERMRDKRLPPVGTKLVKRDRHGTGRAECEIEPEGIRYAGVLYTSLSAAASAAAKDLGLKATVNGFCWWGLVKTARPAVTPAERLRNIGQRYEESARSFLTDASTDEVMPRIREELEQHTAHVQRLLEQLVA